MTPQQQAIGVTLLFSAIVGYFGFGEKLSIKEWIGFALALASVVLLVRDH